jgi:deoxyadenosine/deoxycytidine kinase
LAKLRGWLAAEQGVVVVTGDIGVGKTTLYGRLSADSILPS